MQSIVLCGECAPARVLPLCEKYGLDYIENSVAYLAELEYIKEK